MKKSVFILILLFAGLFGMAQKKDTVVLNEVNVIETFRPTGNTPVTEKTISREEILNSSFGQEVPVFLNSTPSVTSYADGGHFTGYTYMRLRGVDQTRINFTLNGVPMNEPEDQGFYSSNFPDFLTSMKSVQIQRGVGITTNGVCSFAGSVNFESVSLQDSQYVNIINSFGSFNSHRTAVEINSKTINKFAFYTRISTAGSDGYRNHSGGTGYSAFFSGGYFGNKNIVKFNAFTGNSVNEMAWIGSSEDEIKNFGNRYNPNSANEKDNFIQSFAQVQYTRAISKKSSLVSTLYYNRLSGNWDLVHTFGDTTENYQLLSNFVGAMSNYKYENKKFHFSAGINANYYERTHAMADKSFVNDLFYKNKGFKNSLSGFSKVEYDVRDFTLFGDVQYVLTQFYYKKDVIYQSSAGFDMLTWKFLNPKIGYSYKFNKQTKIYFSVGQTHREPTRTDMFAGEDNIHYIDSVNTNFTKIKPETVLDYEGGVKYNTNKISLQANFFYMSFNNEITLLGAVGDYSLPLMTSVKESYRSGIELDFSYKLKNFTIGNSSSYMHAEIKTDSGTFTPVMTPDFVFNQSFSYQLKSLCFNTSFSYVTDRYMNLSNTAVLESSYNVCASIKYTYKKSEVTIGANNITTSDKVGNLSYDNGYIDEAGTPRFFVCAPRNYTITLRLSF